MNMNSHVNTAKEPEGQFKTPDGGNHQKREAKWDRMCKTKQVKRGAFKQPAQQGSSVSMLLNRALTTGVEQHQYKVGSKDWSTYDGHEAGEAGRKHLGHALHQD